MLSRILQSQNLRGLSGSSAHAAAALRHAPLGLQTLLEGHGATEGGDAPCACAMCLQQLHSDAGRPAAHSAAHLWLPERQKDVSPVHAMRQPFSLQHAMQTHSAAAVSCEAAPAALTSAAPAALTSASATSLQLEQRHSRHTQHGVVRQSTTRRAVLHAAPQPARFSTAAMGAPSVVGQPAMGSPAATSAASAAPMASQGLGAAEACHPDQPAGATAAGLNAWWDDDGCFEYRAPLSTTVRRLKKLSLFSCAASIAAAPIIVGLDPETAAAGGKAAIAGMLASFGMFTTGLLHWFVSPYVHRLRYDPANGWIETARLDIFARPVVSHFGVEEAQYADTMRPQATFKVRNSYYYLDADHLGNQQLFDRLNIADPDAPAQEPAQPPQSAAHGDTAPGSSAGDSPADGAELPRDQSSQESTEPGESLPRGAEEAPTAPPKDKAEEAAAKQAEEAAAMASAKDGRSTK